MMKNWDKTISEFFNHFILIILTSIILTFIGLD